ncbi:MAG: hypothetical protein IJT11_05200, partial [Bacteroidaceae bacterium]|nr:hypothetical protein [Bacteroidaceae bacterium]
PNSANLLRLPLNQRRKVLQLTPAAFAGSFLYIAFMLQRYEKRERDTNKNAFILYPSEIVARRSQGKEKKYELRKQVGNNLPSITINKHQ